MGTFEDKHPDLNPSKICGQVNSFTNEELVNGKLKLTEWYERDPITGEMVDVLERKKLEQEIEKLKQEMEKLQ